MGGGSRVGGVSQQVQWLGVTQRLDIKDGPWCACGTIYRGKGACRMGSYPTEAACLEVFDMCMIVKDER